MKYGPLTDPSDIAEAASLVADWKPRLGCSGDFTAKQRRALLEPAVVAFGNNASLDETNVLSILWRHVEARHHTYGTAPEALWCRDAAMESVRDAEATRGRKPAVRTKTVLFRVGKQLSRDSFDEPTHSRDASAMPYTPAEIAYYDRLADTLTGRHRINYKAALDLSLGFGVTSYAVGEAHANDFRVGDGIIRWEVPVGKPRIVPCGAERVGAIRHLLEERRGKYLLRFGGDRRPGAAFVKQSLAPPTIPAASRPKKFRLAATWRRNRFLAGTPVDVIWFIADQPLPSAITAIADPIAALTDTQLRQAARAPQPTQLGLPMWGQP